ncbi:hypothetical protein Pint_29192 [Pistacia integerrima]|uniref:Uncharacterized protein n=1 Tax=Pistacia integerrima TaxID=434235 RepID=A0ACC0X0V9_9ROSI|nr:hypothetical protein Pint_29192 [Pistacia integerrima]
MKVIPSSLKIMKFYFHVFINKNCFVGFERLSHLTNLVDLDLSDNMFNGSHVLSGLSQHSSLKNLSLDYNQFRELNHFNVSRLSNLESLSLSGNMFNNSILSYVSTLSSLKVLDLNNVGLKGIVDLQDLDSLSNLEELYMGGNEIKKVVFSKGETSLRKLTWLGLSNMSISDGNSLLQTLGLFPSLKSLEFFDTNFSGAVITNELPSFKNLTNLIIFETVFHNNFLQMIGGMTSLQSIKIEYSNLGINDTLFDQELPSFKNLTNLTISDMVFDNNFLQMIGGMTSLQSIEISGSDLSFNDTLFDQELPSFKNLTNLIIDDTVFHNNFLQMIGGMTSLQYIEIRNSNLSINDTLFDKELPLFKNLTNLIIYNTIFHNNFLQMIEGMTSLQSIEISSSNLNISDTLFDKG